MSYLTQMAGLAVQNFVSAGGRDGGARGGRARSLASLARRARQLLAGPLPLAASTSCCRWPLILVGDPDLAGRRPDLPRPRDGDDARGRAADDRARPGRFADRDQAARARTAAASTTRTPAVPFENPNGLTNFFELLAILLIPAGQVFMFGRMVLARRHAWMVLRGDVRRLRDRRRDRAPARAARLAGAARLGRQHHPGQRPVAAATCPTRRSAFGIANTALWATATTDASNGSVNGGHDALDAGRRRRAGREHVHSAR